MVMLCRIQYDGFREPEYGAINVCPPSPEFSTHCNVRTYEHIGYVSSCKTAQDGYGFEHNWNPKFSISPLAILHNFTHASQQGPIKVKAFSCQPRPASRRCGAGDV